MRKARKDFKNLNNYLERNINIQDSLLNFLDNDNSNDAFNNFLNNISKKNKQKKLNLTNITQNERDFENFLDLLLTISNNHHRTQGFFTKINQILKFFSKNIRNIFSKSEIFDIFFSNKEILLLLIKNKTIELDETMADKFLKEDEKNDSKYCHFFIHEIEKIITKAKLEEITNELLAIEFNNIDNYEEKRLIGENDFTISSIIRNDILKDFISYVNQTNLSLSSRINTSIYETNPFLINKNPTLIEYATFCGSIQIFNFLFEKVPESKKSLWLYAIHSNKIELIHHLIDQKIKPEDETFLECLKESIKCHNNEIAEYIKSNLLFQENNQNDFTNEKIVKWALKYYNYFYFPKNYERIEFFYLCKYNYSKIIDLFLKTKKEEINNLLVLNQIFVFL